MNKDVIINNKDIIVASDNGNIRVVEGNTNENVINVLDIENKIEECTSNIEFAKEHISNCEREQEGFKMIMITSALVGACGIFAPIVSYASGTFRASSLLVTVGFAVAFGALSKMSKDSVNRFKGYIEKTKNKIELEENEKYNLEKKLEEEKTYCNYQDKSQDLIFDEALSNDKIMVLKLNKR